MTEQSGNPKHDPGHDPQREPERHSEQEPQAAGGEDPDNPDDPDEFAETSVMPPSNGQDTESEAPGDPPADAEARAAENWDKYLRAVAELDNLRKRSAREMANARKFAVERFAGDLLAVADSLEAGIAAADAADASSLLEGKRATLQLLKKVFEQHGVAEIDPAGAPFDPQEHEAMTTLPTADAEPGTVLDVVQKGYLLNGRLLRPARVVVSREPDGASA